MLISAMLITICGQIYNDINRFIVEKTNNLKFRQIAFVKNRVQMNKPLILNHMWLYSLFLFEIKY